MVSAVAMVGSPRAARLSSATSVVARASSRSDFMIRHRITFEIEVLINDNATIPETEKLIFKDLVNFGGSIHAWFKAWLDEDVVKNNRIEDVKVISYEIEEAREISEDRLVKK